VEFAEWTKLIPESEIRRLLRYKVKYYFAGGKPGVLPLGTFPLIMMEIAKAELEAIFSGNEKRVIDDYNYGPTEGLPEVRKVMARIMRERDGIDLDPEEGWKDVLITTGSQQAIHLIMDVLTNPGDLVVVPQPVYLGFVNVVSKFLSNVITVPSDLNGVIPEYVEEAIAAAEKQLGKKPKMVYVVPDSDNPSGTTMPEDRRRKLLDIVKDKDIYLVEDAAYREIQFRGEKLKPIRYLDKEGTHVIYLRSTSKEVAVLRVGYSLMPPEVREQVIKAKGYNDLCTPTITQKIAALYYEKYFEEYIKKVREGYRKRYEAMAKAIDENFPEGVRTDPTGGFFIWWISANKEFDAKKFLEEVAIPNEVLYVPGEAFYPIKGYSYDPESGKLINAVRKKNEMRLSYSYSTVEEIEEGISFLGKLLKQHS